MSDLGAPPRPADVSAAAHTLEVRGLTKSYGAVTAVSAVDFQVAPGTVLGFLGPNGAGKTTVVRLLSTILQPDAGSFSVAGVPHTRPVEIRRRIGVLPESAGYPAGQSGEEWLEYHGRLFGRSRSDARAAARRLLGEVGLADRGRSLVSGYSRGMRQRLGIARALVNDPQVVFLDEPTLGLDPFGQAQVLDLVVRIAREHGVTVVLSTHVLAEVERVCDEVLILNRGRVVAQGSVADICRRAAAPRRAVLTVPARLHGRALEVLAATQVTVDDGQSRPGEIALALPSGAMPEDASADTIRRLLEAGVPVTGFTLEGGRLSDAFLTLTGEGT